MSSKEITILKPAVLVSRCLGFDRCRYNGAAIEAPLVTSLMPFVEFVTVCPEMEIGLGVPRDPIRVVKQKDILRLVQPSSGRDVTEIMDQFSAQFLGDLPGIDGGILKSRSPSCGIKDVKIFPNMAKTNAVAKGIGFFAQAAINHFPHLPVEDEGRLLNLRLRESFLTRIFINRRWRELAARNKMNELVQFHSGNKFLYMSLHEQGLRVLGRIVGNLEKKPVTDVFKRYGEVFYKTMSRVQKTSTNVNVLMHALGYFSKQLTAREKQFFLDALGKYRRGKVPLSVCLGIMNSWIARFNEQYLAQQSYFAPYPEELGELYDSGKGRDVV